MSVEPKRINSMAIETPKVEAESSSKTFSEAWDTERTGSSPIIVEGAYWASVGGGFVISPYVGTPNQHIYSSNL